MEGAKLPVVGRLIECVRCKRKILIEYALIGADHSISVSATCWDCLSKERKEWSMKKYRLRV
jgi:hypothetical protein